MWSVQNFQTDAKSLLVTKPCLTPSSIHIEKSMLRCLNGIESLQDKF